MLYFKCYRERQTIALSNPLVQNPSAIINIVVYNNIRRNGLFIIFRRKKHKKNTLNTSASVRMIYNMELLLAEYGKRFESNCSLPFKNNSVFIRSENTIFLMILSFSVIWLYKYYYKICIIWKKNVLK